jgi:integrase
LVKNLKVPRLGKSRHGVFYVRAPVLEPSTGKRRVIQKTLNTKDPALARLFALRFCLFLAEGNAVNTNKGLIGGLADSINPLKITTPTGETVDFDPSNPAEAAFAEKFLKERTEWRQTMTLQDAMKAAPPLFSQPSISSPSIPDGMFLKDVFQQHLDEEAQRGYVAKTLSEKRALMRDFVGFFGNIPINQITKSEISSRWRSVEQRRPNGKDATKKRGPVTLEKRRGYLSKFFTWAYEAGYYHHENPASQKMATKSEINEQRKSWAEFTSEDVGTLFKPDYITEMDKPDFYWLPLMSLFSGARLGELARLELSTFEEVDGVKCYRILDAKTKDGKRTVPIHSQLIALGLWDYVEALKKKGEAYLLPHRPQDPVGTQKKDRTKDPEKAAGRKWGLWVEQCGIKDTAKVFHSFRSTAITDLHNADAGHAAIKRSVGHTGEGMTGAHSSYVRGIKLVTLQKAVELLNHPQVNFEALKLADPTFRTFFEELKVKAADPKAIQRAESQARHEKAKAEREERNRDKRKAGNK